MNSLQDNIVAKLLPSSLQSDPFVVALANALEKEFKEAYREAESLSNLSDVSNLPEHLLDFLAYQRHVDFYENTLPLDQKRKLIEQATQWHRKKGTPMAVENVVSIIFDDAKVTEWFKYGGRPYFFKIELNHHTILNNDLSRLREMVEATKNKRSKLESVEIITKESLVLNTHLYNFPIEYRICNKFQTANKPGALANTSVQVDNQSYGFDVYYPICNTFNTSQISVEEEQINVMLAEEYQNNDVLYKRVGEVYVGEGEI
ncbi:phage tail protein I [Gracilibacillus oryzae]|uniref:Phage tail protein I n=1 Tax=Gracilibacillus oryzae TaxID=1672701 RepID=A0A7C8GR62_9BACI|nr:phage tail protein I [Gracilibacillus oryzae]KAB8126897.1 phage tail protein I [Gracilibacillus oryzae]